MINMSENKVFNKDLCIICQEHIKKVPVVSTENGRKQIRLAADLRQDIVLCRLNLLPKEDEFCYHVNNKCYKAYVHKKEIDKLKNSRNQLELESENSACSSLNNENNDLRKSKRYSDKCIFYNDRCIICGKPFTKRKGKLQDLISLERAQRLMKASEHFKDDVFIKVTKFFDAKTFIEAGVKYHPPCLRSYENKYETCTKANTSGNDELSLQNKSLELNSIINDLIKSIEPRITAGEIFSLKDLSQLLLKQHGSDFSVKYDRIKTCLINYFGNNICFIYSNQKNQPQIFHYYNISENVKHYYNRNSTSDCANILKESVREIDFQLNDKFCDENDLKNAWQTLSIPAPFIEFMSEFFNCKKTIFLQSNIDFPLINDQSKNDIESLRLKSLFQIIYFIKNKGLKKTPLHVLIGMFVYITTKSKITITILNRLGLCVSYDEVLRIRTRLATYAIKSCQSVVPLPCHFSPHNFVTAAFDNIDHNEATVSGLNSMHDTAFVIFQNFNDCNRNKPNISDFCIDKQIRSFSSTLKCQEVKIFQKTSNLIELPSDYSTNHNHQKLTIEMYENGLNLDDFIWMLCRIKISEDNNNLLLSNKEQQVPTWSSFFASVNEDCRPKQIVGYLPILPAPVTEYSTVYTSLCNFKDLLSQLDQSFLPIVCDEGVYRIARHIKLQREKEFENIIICLGSFHIIKVVLSCIGKYLRNSGVENIFIETGLFGTCVTDQLLNGTNYSRSVKAFNYLLESLRRLQIKEFFNQNNLSKYQQQIVILNMLQHSFHEKNFEECKKTLLDFKGHFSDLLKDFHAFVTLRCEESEMFAYWNNVLILIDLMHDLIRADRMGDWELHLRTIYKLQPLFHVFDRVNYSRWCSVYLEDMLQLQTKAPEVYKYFKEGRFTVKRSDVPFTSVGTDQALEQTINRTSKSAGGIIGSTKKKETVAVWDITFHEFIAISNFFRALTMINNENELESHHEYSNASTQHSESAVDKILDFIIKKEANPFKPGKQALRNIITEQLVNPDITKEILNIFRKGIDLYENFRDERFIKKSKPLSAVIPKNNLPDLKMVPKTGSNKTVKRKVTSSETQRIIMLATERNYPLEFLFQYELTNLNILFDENGLIKKEANKSLLSRELEKILLKEPSEQLSSDLEMCLVIDVMLMLRKISWKGMTTFKDLAQKFKNFVYNKAASFKASRIDLIFDSYFDNSVKSSEHERRRKSDSIKYNIISERITLPKQEEKFWGSSENKILLQKFLKNSIVTDDKFLKYKLICSTINDDACISSNLNANHEDLQTLQRFDIEEADVKIMIHLHHCIKKGYEHAFILSSDTDVMVLALYFFKNFNREGLQSLWIEVGTSNSKRNIPLHTLARLHGDELCSVLPALHHLTGSDYTSKIGTKLSALQADPTKFLMHFGTNFLQTSIDNDVKNAEEFLVRVLKKNATCKTFNELRLWSFHHAKCALVEELPPTSNSIALHIMRAFYIVYTQTQCLNANSPTLDPTQYGFIIQDDLLMPKKIQILLPPTDELTPSCSCKVCTKSSCYCLAAEIPCCSFCVCQRNNTCKNIYNAKN